MKNFAPEPFVEQLIHSFDSVDITVKKNLGIKSEEELNLISENQQINYLLELVKNLRIVDSNYSLDQMSTWYATWKGIILGMNNFTVPSITAPITFYRALLGDYTGNEGDKNSENVEHIDVEGDHYSVLKSDNARYLAKLFAKRIN